MKIKRDGVEIELTETELYDAWHEKQEQYYTEDITREIDDALDGVSDDEVVSEYGCTAEQLRTMIPEMVYKFWDYADSNELIGDALYQCREAAIKGVADIHR